MTPPTLSACLSFHLSRRALCRSPALTAPYLTRHLPCTTPAMYPRETAICLYQNVTL